MPPVVSEITLALFAKRVDGGIRATADAGVSFITLLLVPVLYSIFVLDLKLVKWEGPKS